MHLSSTINPGTRLEDVAVVVVALDGKRKFISRPPSYKDLQRLIRSYFGLDEQTLLVLHVSTLDVCGGQDVELTEGAYPLLAPVLDLVSASVVADANPGIRTPAATPPVSADEEEDDDDATANETDRLNDEPTQNDTHNAEVAAILRTVKQESDDEEVFVGSRFGGDSDAEEDSHPEKPLSSARRVKAERGNDEEEQETKPLRLQRSPKKQQKPTSRNDGSDTEASTPKARAKTAQRPNVSPPIAGPSTLRTGANLTRVDTTATTSSEHSSAEAERFKITLISGKSGASKEFKTRGSHTVEKILGIGAKHLNL
ncbi:hypothetical protein C8F01DRAFT_1082504 [Mycena amicta]|nr:hypothetical protein C8F01DRAFT_1082504 [Mycena amicta]